MTTPEKAKAALIKKDKQSEQVAIPSTFAGMNSNQIAKVLEMYRLQISNVLPPNITPERILQIITTIIAKNSYIAECTIPSIIGATIQCAIFGFDPSPELGLCYFVPRRNKKTGLKEIQFQLGYKGFIQLAYRSNEMKIIYSHVVFENDSFRYQLGLNPDIQHEPNLENPGIMKAVYAVYKTKSGGVDFAVMSRRQVMQIKAKSDASGSDYSPWNVPAFEGDMWRKTVLKKLLKTAPLSIDDRRNIAVDNAVIYDSSLQQGGHGADITKIEYIEDDNGNGNGEQKQPEPAKEVKPSEKEIFWIEWKDQTNDVIQSKFEELSGKIPGFKWESMLKTKKWDAGLTFDKLTKAQKIEVLWDLKDYVKA